MTDALPLFERVRRALNMSMDELARVLGIDVMLVIKLCAGAQCLEPDEEFSAAQTLRECTMRRKALIIAADRDLQDVLAGALAKIEANRQKIRKAT